MLPPRRSPRLNQGKPPQYLRDYVCSSPISQNHLPPPLEMDDELNNTVRSGQGGSGDNPPSPAELQSQLALMQSQIQSLMLKVMSTEAENMALREQIQQRPAAVQQPATVQPPEQPSSAPASFTSTLFVPNGPPTQMRKLYDLPPFNGQPEQWPLFSAAYKQSTDAYSYSKLENLMRLQKALVGEARDSVQCLLINPDNIDDVMSALELRFGRPEALVHSQLKMARQIQPISDNNLAAIVPFASKVQNLATFLNAPKTRQHLANPVLIDELVQKLPINKRIEWAQHSSRIEPYPNLTDLSRWINEYASFVNIAMINTPMTKPSSTYQPTTNSQPYRQPRQQRNVTLHSHETPPTEEPNLPMCASCSNLGHTIHSCESFKKLDPNDRWARVKCERLCFSCLKRGHGSTLCRTRKLCGINGCRMTHHQLLHEEKKQQTPERRPNPFNRKPSDEASTSKTFVNCLAEPLQPEFLFRVVPVKLFSATKEVSTFALLDEGSSISLLDEEIANELDLKGESSTLELHWFGDRRATEPSRIVDLNIKGINEKCSFAMNNVRTVKNISLPAQTLNNSDLHSKFRHLKRLPVSPMVRATPKLLIGLDHCHLGVASETFASQTDQPIAVKTKLGWVVFGPANSRSHATSTVLHSHQREQQMNELDNLIKNYFTTENFGVSVQNQPLHSKDDERALSILESTTTRAAGNRFQTGLLWQSDDVRLPDSFSMALNRLTSIERRMRRDQVFAIEYEKILMDYVAKGYAKKLTSAELKERHERVWYLPHFAVLNPNKPDKIRLVFDAAATVDGTSLNSVLLKGPDLNHPLIDTLFNFRIGAIGVCGDIREMFHQVLIQPSDQNAQRFLWRHGNENGELETYVMLAMTFGSSCSPCSAQFAKNKNATEHRANHPEAVDAILNHHYVDDYVISFGTSEQAIRVTRDVIKIHKDGCFELRNFSSNSQDVLNAINPSQLQEQPTNLQLDAKNSEKILGMYWETHSDCFMFELRFAKVRPEIVNHTKIPTKRQVLSLAMSIFDPFGILAIFTLHAKVLFQDLWKTGLGWDDPIPETAFDKWSKWLDALPKIKLCRVPRCYSPCMIDSDDVQLHVFADASESAFAAVAYWRIRTSAGFDVSFIMGKTKCAPPKLLSIPRLELQAAILATRLFNCVKSAHDVRISKVQFWTDSKTVVQWIHSDSRRYKPFVAHRIAEILDTTNSSQWRWLSTHENVADDATRVNTSPDFDPNSRWLKGPEFLKNDEDAWPPNLVTRSEPTEEIRAIYVNVVHQKTPLINFERFSNFSRLRRAAAWVTRFVHNLIAHVVQPRTAKRHGELTASELDAADILLCQLAQQDAFATEYDNLLTKKPIDRSSSIFKLSPYLAEDKVIRIEGRIDAAGELPFETRRPMILPKSHILSNLIVFYYHSLCKHQNEGTTICAIRQKYWLPQIRRAVRTAASRCIFCRVRSAKPQPQMMGPHPIDRLQPYVRPFTYTGLDYFGPVYVTVGRRQEKRWVALFTCLTVRAVHLELAADLSTDACILCLRNFVNIRGLPKRIRSDNGTNFVGAKHEWVNSADLLDHQAIQRELSSKGVEWVFNCPANPSAGGCWERMVRSIKNVLAVTLKQTAPRVETLRSLLIEAANIINSRPLTHVPVDSIEDEPLTPNDFLIGPTTHDPTTNLIADDHRNLSSRKQWRIAQQIMHSFWRRWVHEYLPDLTRRSKWFANVPPLKPGDLVLICDENQPRKSWRRGIIAETFTGKDGRIRTALVRTAEGACRRPAVKLALLDITNTNGESSAKDSRGDLNILYSSLQINCDCPKANRRDNLLGRIYFICQPGSPFLKITSSMSSAATGSSPCAGFPNQSALTISSVIPKKLPMRANSVSPTTFLPKDYNGSLSSASSSLTASPCSSISPPPQPQHRPTDIPASPSSALKITPVHLSPTNGNVAHHHPKGTQSIAINFTTGDGGLTTSTSTTIPHAALQIISTNGHTMSSMANGSIAGKLMNGSSKLIGKDGKLEILRNTMADFSDQPPKKMLKLSSSSGSVTLSQLVVSPIHVLNNGMQASNGLATIELSNSNIHRIQGNTHLQSSAAAHGAQLHKLLVSGSTSAHPLNNSANSSELARLPGGAELNILQTGGAVTSGATTTTANLFRNQNGKLAIVNATGTGFTFKSDVFGGRTNTVHLMQQPNGSIGLAPIVVASTQSSNSSQLNGGTNMTHHILASQQQSQLTGKVVSTPISVNGQGLPIIGTQYLSTTVVKPMVVTVAASVAQNGVHMSSQQQQHKNGSATISLPMSTSMSATSISTASSSA